MLNGFSLNRAAVNATAAVALVAASAVFSAEATVTAAATQLHTARANITASVSAIFSDAYLTQYARTEWDSTATATFDANRILAGVGAWSGEGTFRGVIYNVVNAEAGFDATASLLMVPDAKLGTGDWSGGATFNIVPTLTESLRGGWAPTSGFAVQEAIITRGVTGDWTGSAELRAEATVTIAGTVYHDGFVFLEHTADLVIDNELTTVFTVASFNEAGADWVANANARYGARASWLGQVTLAMEAWKIQSAQVDMGTATAVFTAEPTHIQAGGVTLTGSASFVPVSTVNQVAQAAFVGTAVMGSEAWMTRAAGGDFTVESTLTMAAVRQAMSTMDLMVSAAISMDGIATHYARTSWNGTAASLAAAAVLSLVPAPESRQFTLSEPQRQFALSGGLRKFKVSV